MKKTLRSFLAVVLVLAMLSSFGVCFAASEKQYLNYKSYVLLGDSIASGWSDLEDADEQNTNFTRVEGSYGDIIAKTLDVDYYPAACIGFRSHEMRYVLEENYAGDNFMFYAMDKDLVDAKKDAIRAEIAKAGLITLNLGSNDWGAYLGWNIIEIMAEFDNVNAEFLTQARVALEEAGTGLDTINKLIDIASYAGCMGDFVTVLPTALELAYANYVENWKCIIEDIYTLNSEATLVVIGMFDTSLQDPVTMADYKAEGLQDLATKLSVSQKIVDYANTTMKDAAAEYGYFYIDPVGTYCELQHPSASGHRHIAELVLKALPYSNFPYEDVKLGDSNYTAIEYMWANDIIPGTEQTVFGVNKILTLGELENAIAALNGEKGTGTSTEPAMRIDIITQLLNGNPNATFMQKIKTFALMIPFFVNNFRFNFLGDVRKGEAAELIYDFVAINY